MRRFGQRCARPAPVSTLLGHRPSSLLLIRFRRDNERRHAVSVRCPYVYRDCSSSCLLAAGRQEHAAQWLVANSSHREQYPNVVARFSIRGVRTTRGMAADSALSSGTSASNSGLRVMTAGTPTVLIQARRTASGSRTRFVTRWPLPRPTATVCHLGSHRLAPRRVAAFYRVAWPGLILSITFGEPVTLTLRP